MYLAHEAVWCTAGFSSFDEGQTFETSAIHQTSQAQDIRTVLTFADHLQIPFLRFLSQLET